MNQPDYEAAAFSGLAINKALPVEERLGAALQALRLYETRLSDLTHELEEAQLRLMSISDDNSDLRDQIVQL